MEQETQSLDLSSEEMLRLASELEILTYETCQLLGGWSERLSHLLQKEAYPELMDEEYGYDTNMLH
jgi:hypothetical protein